MHICRAPVWLSKRHAKKIGELCGAMGVVAAGTIIQRPFWTFPLLSTTLCDWECAVPATKDRTAIAVPVAMLASALTPNCNARSPCCSRGWRCIYPNFANTIIAQSGARGGGASLLGGVVAVYLLRFLRFCSAKYATKKERIALPAARSMTARNDLS